MAIFNLYKTLPKSYFCMYRTINLQRIEISDHFKTFEKTFFYIISVILRSIKTEKRSIGLKKGGRGNPTLNAEDRSRSK